MRTHLLTLLSSALSTGLLVGCGGEGGPGDLVVVLEPETTITDGLVAGAGEDDVVDGWTVTFDTYVVSVSDVTISRAGEADLTDPVAKVVDLTALSGPTFEVLREEGITSGRWTDVRYSTTAVTSGAWKDASVSQADFDLMVANGCSYLVRGTLSKASGQSCPPGGSCRAAATVDFDLCVDAVVTFEECGPEGGRPGIVVPAGGSVTAALTLHGDHLFFSSFPAGEEVVMRRAQWLADADVDADGTVTTDELAGISGANALSALFPSASYNLANAPGGTITDALDFVRAQLQTQGHFQGEGECAFVVP